MQYYLTLFLLTTSSLLFFPLMKRKKTFLACLRFFSRESFRTSSAFQYGMFLAKNKNITDTVYSIFMEFLPSTCTYQDEAMIIDFRVRPPIESYLRSGAFEVWENPNSPYRNQWEGRIKTPSMDGDMDLFVKEMTDAGIDISVIIGRMTKVHDKGRGNVTADDLLSIMKKYPGRFAGMPAVDPLASDAMEQIERAAAMGMVGICIEPFWSSEPLFLNDSRLFPLYKKIESLGLLFTTTLNFNCGESTKWNSPYHVEQIAMACPAMPILITHACWPLLTELMAIAVRYPNIYLIPDCYFYFPFINTAKEQRIMYNHMLQDQVLFGSSYPIRGFGQAVELSLEQGQWLPGPKEKFFWKNGAKLLHLQIS